MGRVGVAILTHEPDPHDVGETISRVVANGIDRADVVVVDNASTAGWASSLPMTWPGVDVLSLTENLGYGAAMNSAAHRLMTRREPDALLFLTQETWLCPGAVRQLAGRLEEDPRLGLVGPLLARRSAPAEVWSAGGALTSVRRKPRHLASGEQLASIANQLRLVEWLDGACLLARRSALEEVCGFREDLFLYWEDVALSLAMRGRGWRVACVTSAVALQEPSMTPPYLMTRNRSLVLGVRGAAGSLLDLVAWAGRDLLHGRAPRRTALGFAGLADAVRRRPLDARLALQRP